MDLKIIYEDSDLLVVDKPAGIIVFQETNTKIQDTKTLIDFLIEKYPTLKNVGEAPRYGIAHRLDKDTSGLLLVAKTLEALIFLQNQFSLPAVALHSKTKEGAGAKSLEDKKEVKPLEKMIEKRYIALVCGNIKNDHGTIHTLMGRSKSDPRKQTAHSLGYTGKTGLREAISEYKVLERFADYTLLEVQIKTGRKHQIRCHMAYLKHPVAGDKVYGFKDSPTPSGLERQFLHAGYLKIALLNGKEKEFNSSLPEELKQIITNLSKN